MAKLEALDAKDGNKDVTEATPEVTYTVNEDTTVVDDTKPYTGPLSTDNNQGVVKAIAYMKTLKTESELNAYAGADTRATVVKALEKLKSDLKDN